ncbi:hypothetical protein N7510_010310 [Penicillium lagena]|uniref:uncharacterized protein n=1 Tax=Penicillium lagena TaxID=94218 RepID=UPI00254228B3|nr:uncharacterized protein N7510_010310 [Penicillium lagena]KAJ5605156.1 hypothetical protein N7510_010310 [Penicillium lagena]
MHFPSLLVPALAALTAAQSTTVISIFEAFIENPYIPVTYSTYASLGGSVVAINAEATTYKVACMSGAPKSDCNVREPYTIVAGPTTISFAQTFPFDIYGVSGTANEDIACSFTHSTESAQCIATVAITSGDVSTSTTSTISVPTDDISYKPITITGGLSLFNSPQATETPDAAAGPHRALVTAAPLGAAAAIAAAAFF